MKLKETETELKQMNVLNITLDLIRTSSNNQIFLTTGDYQTYQLSWVLSEVLNYCIN